MPEHPGALRELRDLREHSGCTATHPGRAEREAHPDEWVEIRDNPQAVAAFALMLREATQLAAGVCPERWTGIATCRRCGPVPVAPCWEGCVLDGCRWCGGMARDSAGRVKPSGA